MLIETPVLVTFLLASVAVYVTPGVDMAYIASNSVNHGARGGLWAAAGTVIGVSTQALAAALGVTAVFATSPLVFELIRWAGVAYLAFLGIRLLLEKVSVDWSREVRSLSPWPTLLKGITINLLNPKVALFFVAFLPQFVDPTQGSVLAQLAALGFLFAAGSTLWCAFLAVLFARIGDRFRASPRFQTWQRRITGSAFVGFAGLLALTDLRR